MKKPKRQKKAIPSNKKKKKIHKGKKDKKNKVTTVKLENGNIKEEEGLMDNAGFEDTEMTEIKVEVPQNLEVVEETEVGSVKSKFKSRCTLVSRVNLNSLQPSKIMKN